MFSWSREGLAVISPSVLCGCMFLFVRSFACDSVHHLLSENIF